MDTRNLLPDIVQAVRQALAPKLATARHSAGSLEDFLNDLDALVLRSTVEGARQALEQVVTEEQEVSPGESAKLLPYRVHTALGEVSFSLWNRAEDGRTERGLDTMQLWHGCTLSVREQCAFLMAQGTAQEARDSMLLFRSSVPSESTIKRVVATDGARMMQVWDAHVAELVDAAFGPVMSQVDMVSTSADGAMVPLRGIAAVVNDKLDGPDDTPEAVASRSYREARIVTVTLYGKPNAAKERMVTLYDEQGKAHGECVGFQRPRLGTLVFGEMPSIDGPKGQRAATALGQILDAIRQARPDVPIKGTTDGGQWPEQTIDEAVGKSNRNADFYHATEHLAVGSKAAYGDNDLATAWYKRWRNRLLTDDGAAQALSDQLLELAQTPGRPAAGRKILEREAGYFRKRADNMQYAELLRNDMVIGSGIVEAAVKRLITLRMKRTGATWTEDGGDAIIALRSIRLSRLWDLAWQIHVRNERASYATETAA